jgi:hypothetical protein
MLGEAADFIVKGADMLEVAQSLTALDNIPFDQLIFENRYKKGRRSSGMWVQWIHVSHRRMGENRGEVLTIVKRGDERVTLRGITAPEAALSAL